MRRSGRSLYLIIVMLGLSGCSASKLDNIKWTQSERNIRAYYQDDAQCLKHANKILFNQLKSAEEKRTRRSAVVKISEQDFSARTCKSNNQRDRIHYDCMIKKGWSPEKK